MIEIQELSFTYKNESRPALKNISLTVPDSAFVGVIGPAGAGKTTTLKLIDGLIRPTEGRVLIDGKDTRETRVSRRARQVGFLFQNPDRQNCQNTVREEILFGLRAVRDGESDEELVRRTESVLEDFGFTGEEEPFSLSRGQRQRVALASILAVEPGVLILDEPTTGLDYRECCHIMDRIVRMNREKGVTVVMVCHDMEVVLDYAQRALVMAGGRLLADGPYACRWRSSLP